MFTDVYKFLDQHFIINNDKNTDMPLALDYQVLPQLIFHNLNSFPKFFKMFYPESYIGFDQDMHMQLAGSVAVILNRRIDNPHMRIEFVSFLLQIMPQKKVDKNHEK